MRIIGYIQNGKLIPQDKNKLLEMLKKSEGKWFELNINRRDRSNSQNRYYWGVIIRTVSEDTGQDGDTVHEYLKTQFLRKQIVFNKKEYIVVGSTSDLTTEEFETYAEKCRQHVGEILGIQIPLPGEAIIQIEK